MIQERNISLRWLVILAFFTVTTLPPPSFAEDGYDLWLRYRVMDDNLINQYGSHVRNIVAPSSLSPMMKAAVSELTRGFSGMLNLNVSTVQTLNDGAIVIGTPTNSDVIRQLSLSLGSLGNEGYLIRQIRQNAITFIVIAGNTEVQVKNGPIDFQPREPFHPLFGVMSKTQTSVEFQITKEYLGFATHIAYLGPMWEEVLDADTFAKGAGSTVSRVIDGTLFQHSLTAIAAVANVGTSREWCGSHFDQANWFVYGRLAWDPDTPSRKVAEEWLRLTFSTDAVFVEKAADIMMMSREAVANYMTPLGLHHLMATGHHYGPGPWIDNLSRPEWNPAYYHNADANGIGFDRTESGSDAISQYAAEVSNQFADVSTLDDRYLLWFHHLPWDYQMKSGKTLWDAIVLTYDEGVESAREMGLMWETLQPYVDSERFEYVAINFRIQLREAKWWRDACVAFFQSISNRPLPEGAADPPEKTLAEYKAIQYPYAPGTNIISYQVSCFPSGIGRNGTVGFSEPLLQGTLFRSYLIGYMISQIPFAYIQQTLSAKCVMAFSIAIHLACLLLMAIADRWHCSLMTIARIIEGIAGGVVFPAMHTFLANWAPRNERNRMSAFIYSGVSLGIAFSVLSFGYTLFLGTVSILWLVVWIYVVKDTPNEQPFIGLSERDYINSSSRISVQSSVPWSKIVTSAPFLAILVAHTCFNWGWYTFLVGTTSYFELVHHFNIKDNAVASVPFFTMWLFSQLLGNILDVFCRSGTLTTTVARKIATLIASVIPMTCLALLCFIVYHPTIEGVIVGIGITSLAGMFCGFLVNHIDIAPNHAGLLMAMTNTIATIPGLLVPIFINVMTQENQTIDAWRIVYVVAIAFYIVGIIVYSIFGSGEEAPWNNSNAIELNVVSADRDNETSPFRGGKNKGSY